MYFSNNDFFVHLREIIPRGLLALKSEYEAEGVRREEFQALSLACKSLCLPLSLKIGGCEAITDLYDCRKYDVDYIIAPMIESTYAVTKYESAIKRIFPDPKCSNNFLINVETISAYKNIDSILDLVSESSYLSGVVFGRVDFSSSLNKGREIIDSDYVKEVVIDVSRKCKERGIEFVLGGGISAKSIDFLLQLSQVHLTRFETRKCIFDPVILNRGDASTVLLQAVHLELLWLNAKRNYYKSLVREDDHRIEMLERRHIYEIKE